MWTDGCTYVRTYAWTFETSFIWSTLLKNRPKNYRWHQLRIHGTANSGLVSFFHHSFQNRTFENKMQSEMVYFAPGAATWWTGRNICIGFDSGLFCPLYKNMTSSTKPEEHNILHHHYRRTLVSWTINWVKFACVVFRCASGWVDWQTDKQTDRHADHNTLPPPTGGGVFFTEQMFLLSVKQLYQSTSKCRVYKHIKQSVALTRRNTTGPPCYHGAIIRLKAAWRHHQACAGEAACRPAVECYRPKQTTTMDASDWY